jgi:hypothetical protein
MFIAGSKKSSLPAFSRGYKRLPILPYSPEDGVAPVFSPYTGDMLYSYVHKTVVQKYNTLIEGTNLVRGLLISFH